MTFFAAPAIGCRFLAEGGVECVCCGRSSIPGNGPPFVVELAAAYGIGGIKLCRIFDSRSWRTLNALYALFAWYTLYALIAWYTLIALPALLALPAGARRSPITFACDHRYGRNHHENEPKKLEL